MGALVLDAAPTPAALPHHRARAIAPRGNAHRPNYQFPPPRGAPDDGAVDPQPSPMPLHDPRAERAPSRAASPMLPRGPATALVLALAAAWPMPARASFLSGDALDAMANGIAWAALVIVPLVAIAVFWIVHILPEKIAEKRRHPQLSAIKTLCLLSLVFGGLLWPIAWLWAYTKPVLHKIAYGTDVDDTPHHGEALSPVADAQGGEPAAAEDSAALRARIASLEAQLAARGHAAGGGGG